MASLNTLRTKFGWILSIIIAVALLAFIVTLDDSVMQALGMRGGDPKVGTMDGQTIPYSEYAETLDGIQRRYGSPQNDEESAQMAEMAWSRIMADRVFAPGFTKAGIRVTDAERARLISGQEFSPTMAMYFTNPETGMFDRDAVSEFLQRAQGAPEMEMAWSELVDGVMKERQAMKYGRLVELGVYANRLEVERAMAIGSKSFNGMWAGERYSNIPDTLYAPTRQEIETYYREHKARFKQQPSRTIVYATFHSLPSEADQAAAHQQARESVEALGLDEVEAQRELDSLLALPVEVSSATRRQVHTQANTFAMNAKGSFEAFNAAAEADSIRTHQATLTQDQRVVGGLTDSRELVRWVNNAKAGAVSPVMAVGGDTFVVAVVTGIDNHEYAPLTKVERTIRDEVTKEKKYQAYAAGMRGKTIDQVAADTHKQPETFENVNYNSFFINGLGMEPRVSGAIAATTETNVPSNPIKGQTGIYMFVVTDIVPADATEPVTAEAERTRLISTMQQAMQQQLAPALSQVAEVKDLRNKYF